MEGTREAGTQNKEREEIFLLLFPLPPPSHVRLSRARARSALFCPVRNVYKCGTARTAGCTNALDVSGLTCSRFNTALGKSVSSLYSGGDGSAKETSAGFLRERHVVDIIPEYEVRRGETRRGETRRDERRRKQRRGAVLISSRVGDATPRAIHVAPLSACPYVRNTFAYSILSSFRSLSPPHPSFFLSEEKTRDR